MQRGWNSLPGENLRCFQGSICALHLLARVQHLVGHPYVDWNPLMAKKIQVIKVYTVHNVERNTKFTYCLYGA